jgi:hypothetical protein
LRFIISIITLLCFCNDLFAQEIKCDVSVISIQVQGKGVDNKVFKSLETSIFEFINNKQWTNNTYQSIEKIDCNLIINITKVVSKDVYKGSIEIQSRRPIYNSSYNSILLNFKDNNFTFKYVENEPLEYSENTYLNNLTSVLAFYIHYIIGLDDDTYELNGGTKNFEKSLNILNSVTGDFAGEWTSGTKNRYWLINNMLDGTFIPLRKCLYEYHLLGLDKMNMDQINGRKAITGAIEKLLKLHETKPLSYNSQVFFDAKSKEIINIYKGATEDEKSKIIPIISKLNPSNSINYKKIK